MQIAGMIGNKALLGREKTLFLCSRRTPVDFYASIFAWVDGLTEEDCVMCCNTTEMETEVMKALVMAGIPIVLVVMNRFRDVNNIQIEHALRKDRMLILILRRDEPIGMGTTAKLRNQFLLSMAKRVVCGYINRGGSVFPLLTEKENVRFLVDSQMRVAEKRGNYQRWSVGDDKVLLRMFYADMGIHAIRMRTSRSYMAIRELIRALTMPEDVLKGREFEDFILELFDVRDSSSFVLKEWRGDKTLGSVYPESNRNADFVFEYIQNGVRRPFAVECKWRRQMRKNIVEDIFPADRVAWYRQFAENQQMPVYFIVGIGGEPCDPETLYLISLDEVSAIVSHLKPLYHFRRVRAQAPFHSNELGLDKMG